MNKTTIIITVVFFMPLNKFAANMLKCCVANIPKRFKLTKNFFPHPLKGSYSKISLFTNNHSTYETMIINYQQVAS